MSKPQRRPHAKPAQRPSNALVLTALERAIRHRAGDAHVAPIWAILDHLQIPRRSGEARRVRAVLEELSTAGQLEVSRPHGVDAWALTDTARRQLARARRDGLTPALPESPQHREWRNARTSAGQEIERFARRLRECIDDASLLLDASEPVPSDMWFELAEALRSACWRLGSASHCLYEWPEPQDGIADVDSRDDPGDATLEADERDRRRARRMGRRNVRLWQEGDQ
jgi:DNA-binding transcriptional regulator PaaX